MVARSAGVYSAGASLPRVLARLARKPSARPPTARIGIKRLTPTARMICRFMRPNGQPGLPGAARPRSTSASLVRKSATGYPISASQIRAAKPGRVGRCSARKARCWSSSALPIGDRTARRSSSSCKDVSQICRSRDWVSPQSATTRLRFSPRSAVSAESPSPSFRTRAPRRSRRLACSILSLNWGWVRNGMTHKSPKKFGNT